MVYQEDRAVSAPYREMYRNGIIRLVQARRNEADTIRHTYVDPEKMKKSQQAYREDLIKLLGWPLSETRTGMPKVKICEKFTLPDENISVLRLQIEALPDVPFYGMLFIPDTSGKKPLVLAQHGGGGTPEHTADFHVPNKCRNMSRILAKAGCVVFAPQLLMWQIHDNDIPGRPGYGLDHERGKRENELRQLGSGIVPVEIYEIMRTIDYLSALEYVDSSRIGMIGISYGGLYTQMVAALDTRIKAAVSVAFFNDRYKYCWHDFSWKGSANCMKDPEICGLIAPRPFCIHIGTNDTVFDYRSALPEIDRLKAYYAAWHEMQNLKIIISETDHTLTDNFEELSFLIQTLGASPFDTSFPCGQETR